VEAGSRQQERPEKKAEKKMLTTEGGFSRVPLLLQRKNAGSAAGKSGL